MSSSEAWSQWRHEQFERRFYKSFPDAQSWLFDSAIPGGAVRMSYSINEALRGDPNWSYDMGVTAATNLESGLMGLATQGVGETGLPTKSSSPLQVHIDPKTGRPISIDTTTFTSGRPTLNGGVRNQQQFWQQWRKAYPETLSSNNLEKLKTNMSPTVDEQWLQY